MISRRGVGVQIPAGLDDKGHCAQADFLSLALHIEDREALERSDVAAWVLGIIADR